MRKHTRITDRGTRTFLLGIVWVVCLWIGSNLCSKAWAADVPYTNMAGTDSVDATFFRKWYHRSDLPYYLEALSDHTIYETMTTGQWWLPERITFAIDGLPCTANRYYIDGMRADDRFQPGSTYYMPNMQQYNLRMDIHRAQMYWNRDTTARNYVQATYNFGQVGNGAPALGTTEIINITHRSAVQSADEYKHITERRHQLGAGTVDAGFTFHDGKGNPYYQHLYAAYGQRVITKENQQGIMVDDPLYTAPYYKVQADGYLPIGANKGGRQVGYRLNFSGRSDAGSENLYNYNEIYDLKSYVGSVFLREKYLTTGLTWETNVTHHNDRSFSKNIIDQDGESFAPWVADGNTHILSWAVNYEQPVLPWLTAFVDAYNSIVHFRPEATLFNNTIYLQSPVDSVSTPLYQYEWTSHAYTGGLLENTVGLKAHYAPVSWFTLTGHADFTLDAILLRNKSKVNPNVQAGVGLDFHPCKWFEAGLSADYNRLPYTMDYLRYFSDDYMNADIYYAGTNHLFATTGGRYHSYKKNLRQTSYIEVNIPIRFHFEDKRGGRHEIVLQNNYKKYFDVWHTYYDGEAEDYGYYQQEEYGDNYLNVFYQNAGAKYYEVGYTPTFGSNGLLNTPYFFSQLTRYTYTGRKVMVSLSWQSMQAAGYTGLGNGANSNTLGVLSETTANPNTTNVVKNQSGEHPGVGRLDLDKGYVARFYLSYNICKWVQAGLTLKWTDGKPFTAYRYFQNDGQVAILPYESRGTNPTDGNFGSRHGAWYMCDLHAQATWTVKDIGMRLKVECYNMWDFCNDLAEFAFVQDIPQANRSSIILNVPTGILATYSIDF